MVVPPAVTVQETERRILDRYLREAYGMIRSKAILKEIDDEVIDIVRNPNFKQELRAPANEEQSIEKKLPLTTHTLTCILCLKNNKKMKHLL